MKKIFLLVIFTISFVLQGCATVNQPALNKTDSSIDTSEKSIILLNVDFYNSLKPKSQATALILNIEKTESNNKSDRQNYPLNPISIDSSNNHRFGLFNGFIEAGDYVLKGISGFAQRALLIGNFFIPIEQEFTVESDSVMYLGKVSAVNRERQDGEFRSGSILPLIDQSITGYSSGTLDVSITDDYDTVLPILRSEYPALSDIDVKNKPLAPFDRTKFDSSKEED